MKTHKILQYSYWLSIICLIHCIAFPLIIATLPLLNIAFEINHWFEIGILLSVIILGSYSLFHAYKTHHKKFMPLIIFYSGVLLSIYVHFIHPHDHTDIDALSLSLEIISGILIASAQFYNLKITPKSCNHSH